MQEWPGCLQTSPLSNAKNFWAVCPCTICLLHVLGTGFNFAELSPYLPKFHMNDHVTCQDSRQRLVLDVILELEVASHVSVARQVVEHEVRVPN